ncbi:hypothetical protein jhhlp_007667 [Lomentospora prolificans]|uniref:CCZ1/INTU/HSP4 first Longin domain-containing protein n=1 Tax=Lomentospora prolificans TaxID=41688 RepID=A0A2N3N080_9PEZI|nr:hypothetical protein jhhlp_007667 [Lomentospora prolificans]
MAASSIIPARLGFLAIYNPSLSSKSEDDDALADQIVYYASVTTQSRRRRRRKRKDHRERSRLTEEVSQEERHERLRQIGLAQGMVEFSRGFSGGEAVDVIETERTRVVVHELEPGWWILTSIDLTRVPLPPKLPTASSSSPREEIVEYSTKEVKPAALLLQDLLRAHSLFLLHHDVSLSRLFDRLGRRRFVSALTRYWDLFLSTWSVIMHGNPMRNILAGTNIAVSGELGVGVGEEDRGSGEREVLEGLVGRIDGLVDLVVSKFGNASSDGVKSAENEIGDEDRAPWLGTGQDPDSEDGAIFLGVGALTKQSLRNVAYWTEDLYTWGENAYGVIGAPSSPLVDKKPKAVSRNSSDDKQSQTRTQTPPLVVQSKNDVKPGVENDGTDQAREDEITATGNLSEATESTPAPDQQQSQEATESHPAHQEAPGHMDKFVNILKLGYGTYWSIGGSDGGPDGSTPPYPSQSDKRKGSIAGTKKLVDETEGYFLIGLRGTVEEHPPSDSSSSEEEEGSLGKFHPHTRTLHVSLTASIDGEGPAGAAPLRAIVYINKPFIFTFLFRPETPALSTDTLYRSLHYQLSPLRKPLLLSTRYRPPRPEEAGPSSLPSSLMYDLIWDRSLNLVHSTIPNIPTGQPSIWTRSEATATHMHLLSLFSSQRDGDVEKTLKTNKGWWIVWSRVESPRFGGSRPPVDGRLPSLSEVEGDGDGYSEGGNQPRERTEDKEVILLRRAGDHTARAFSVPVRDGASRLAQGIGVDTRGYVETLLSLVEWIFMLLETRLSNSLLSSEMLDWFSIRRISLASLVGKVDYRDRLY